MIEHLETSLSTSLEEFLERTKDSQFSEENRIKLHKLVKEQKSFCPFLHPRNFIYITDYIEMALDMTFGDFFKVTISEYLSVEVLEGFY